MRRELLVAVIEAQKAKRPVALVTDLDSGAQSLIASDGLVAGDRELADVGISAAAADAIREDRCRRLDTPRRRVFVQVVNPSLRMAIVGAVHITQALAPIANPATRARVMTCSGMAGDFPSWVLEAAIFMTSSKMSRYSAPVSSS